MTTLTKFGFVESFESGQDFIPDVPAKPAYDTYREYYVMRIVGWEVYGIPSETGTGLVYVPRVERVLVREVTHHPAEAAIPGQPYRPASIVINKQLGWNGGATGIPTIVASGQYTFTVDSDSIGVVTGFGRVATNEQYKLIEYGLYFNNSQWFVYESGSHPPSAQGYFEDGDEFVIRRLGPEVAYYQNGTLIYRSEVPSSGVLLVSACMYSSGDVVNDAAVADSVDAALSETTDGELTVAVPVPTVGMGGDDGLSVAVPVPTVELFEPDYAVIEVPVPVPTVALVSPDADYLNVSVPVPTVDIEGIGFLVPAYGFLDVLVPTPTVFMYFGLVPTLEVDVPVPHVFLGTLEATLNVPVPTPNVGMLSLDYPQIIAHAPRARIEIVADVLPEYYSLGLKARSPMATVTMYGGARLRTTAIMPTVAISVTVPVAATIDATAPMATVSMSAFAGSVGTLAATAPLATVSLQGGGRLEATAPLATVSLTGFGGTVGTITATAPRATIALTGYSGAVATLAATAPMATMGGAGYIRAYFPMARVSIVQQAAAAMGYAYAVTLNNEKKPVTRYTGYNFKDIIRLGDRHIGFGPTGAHELTGTDDNGTAIEWSVTFGETGEAAGMKEGEIHNKRCEATYWYGSFVDTVTMSVAVDGGNAYEYTKDPPDADLRPLRILTGKGLLGHYWQFGLSGSGAMTLHKAEFLNHPMKRKVRYA